MDKEIVIIVSNETAAYEGVRSPKALDDEGSIELYASTVVTKSPSGVMTIQVRATCTRRGRRCSGSRRAR